MTLENRVAIVTGAAGAIGRSISLSIVKEGAIVIIADINFEEARKVVSEITGLGGKARAIKTDVSRNEDVKLMVQTILDEYGVIDILVNNAGVSDASLSEPERGSLFCDTAEELWDHIIAVNLKGVLNCSQAVINHMIEQRYGKIVNIASICGINGCTSQVVYSASKGGIIAFTKALAKEVAHYGINVNCISPGVIETPWTSNRQKNLQKKYQQIRLGKPEEIADMVIFLVSNKSSFIIGQNYAVCGGSSIGYQVID
jgi:NAD(P)-dependent dehydrogenase (short-subunit alcohol dehydrogenase family)